MAVSQSISLMSQWEIFRLISKPPNSMPVPESSLLPAQVYTSTQQLTWVLCHISVSDLWLQLSVATSLDRKPRFGLFTQLWMWSPSDCDFLILNLVLRLSIYLEREREKNTDQFLFSSGHLIIVALFKVHWFICIYVCTHARTHTHPVGSALLGISNTALNWRLDTMCCLDNQWNQKGLEWPHC